MEKIIEYNPTIVEHTIVKQGTYAFDKNILIDSSKSNKRKEKDPDPEDYKPDKEPKLDNSNDNKYTPSESILSLATKGE